jgi:hypothetical protein
MKNVTITLDETVARWARIRAAERNTSVSRLVGEMLRERMVADDRYAIAMERYLAQRPSRLRPPRKALPKRDDLHDRSGLR